MGKWTHTLIVGLLIFIGFVAASMVVGFIIMGVAMVFPFLAAGLVGTIITFLITAIALGLTIPWLLRRFA